MRPVSWRSLEWLIGDGTVLGLIGLELWLLRRDTKRSDARDAARAAVTAPSAVAPPDVGLQDRGEGDP